MINYEPRINLTNVAVDDDQDKNRLVVDIYFRIIGIEGPQVVSNIFTENKIVNVKQVSSFRF